MPETGAWDDLNGQASLDGDAAHPMTMCECWRTCNVPQRLTNVATDRGEAANHGVTDVESWLKCHLPKLLTESQDDESYRAACTEYEHEVVR